MIANVLLLRPRGKTSHGRLFATEQLGLAYIAAVARENKLTVKIVDGFLEPFTYGELLDSIIEGDYDLVGFPVYPETLLNVARDAARIKKRCPKLHITIGNHLPTLCGENVLSDFSQFDSAIIGEGEYTLTELASFLKENKNWREIPGICYRENAEIKKSKNRQPPESLDHIPFPARDTLPLVLAAGNGPLLYSSRGCYAKCSFCSVHNFFSASGNPGWRCRTPKNVVDEMEKLFKDFGVSEFAFADEQFMGYGAEGKERAIGIASEIRRRKLSVKWYIETRTSDIEYETFSVLKEAGLHAVFMGIESGIDETLLKVYKKGIRAEQHLHALAILKSLEILSSVGFIMFQPDTTLDELEANADFLSRLEGVEVTALLTKLRIYPGTATEKKMLAENKLKGKYYKYEWDFERSEVAECYDAIMDSAELLSVMYNEFAALRRTGLLTFPECLRLQVMMNARAIGIFKKMLKILRKNKSFTKQDREMLKSDFEDTAEEYLMAIQLSELLSKNRTIENNVRLLTPMSLC